MQRRMLTGKEKHEACFFCWALSHVLTAGVFVIPPVLGGYGAFALLRDTGMPYSSWYVGGGLAALLIYGIGALRYHVGKWVVRKGLVK